MSRRKLKKLRQKVKNKKMDKLKTRAYAVDAKCEEFSSDRHIWERELQTQTCSKSTGRKVKSSKQVHFSVLPDKYQPLEEDTVSDTAAEEPHGEKYKGFRKKFGKALRFTWKCLVVGLQNFSASYSGPLSAASTLVPEIQRPNV